MSAAENSPLSKNRAQPDNAAANERERPRITRTAPSFSSRSRRQLVADVDSSASASPTACERGATGNTPHHSRRRSRCSSRHKTRMRSSDGGGRDGSARGQNSHRSTGCFRRTSLHFDCLGCLGRMAPLQPGPTRVRKTRRDRRWIHLRPRGPMERQIPHPGRSRRRGFRHHRGLLRRRHQTRSLKSPERRLPVHSAPIYA